MKNTSILLVSLLLIILFTGCTPSEYKTATAMRNDIRFRFEYPANFKDPTYTLNDSSKYAAPINLVRFVTEDKTPEADCQITILTIPGDEKTNSVSLLELDLEGMKNPRLPVDMTTLERRREKVSGIDGEVLVSTGIFYPGAFTHEFISNHIHNWNLYLDYKGKVVMINLVSVSEKAAESELIFRHLIKTFKFLN